MNKVYINECDRTITVAFLPSENFATTMATVHTRADIATSCCLIHIRITNKEIRSFAL